MPEKENTPHWLHMQYYHQTKYICTIFQCGTRIRLFNDLKCAVDKVVVGAKQLEDSLLDSFHYKWVCLQVLKWYLHNFLKVVVIINIIVVKWWEYFILYNNFFEIKITIMTDQSSFKKILIITDSASCENIQLKMTHQHIQDTVFY